jgi:hypothetical protein
MVLGVKKTVHDLQKKQRNSLLNSQNCANCVLNCAANALQRLHKVQQFYG